MTCSGERLPHPPYSFTSIHLHFVAKGPVRAAKLERAIALTENRYCSVITTLKPKVTVVCDYEIDPGSQA